MKQKPTAHIADEDRDGPVPQSTPVRLEFGRCANRDIICVNNDDLIATGVDARPHTSRVRLQIKMGRFIGHSRFESRFEFAPKRLRTGSSA